MSTLLQIVPRNLTLLQRALVETADAWSRHSPLLHEIIDVRYRDTIPEDVLPWLLRHWGLEDAAAFMTDHQRLYDEGKRWQTRRGRVAAFEMILDWLGLDGWYESGTRGDVRWGLFQIGLNEPHPDVDPANLRNLVGLGDLSRKASSTFARVYGGYDIRPVRLDGQRLDGAMLDDWSGVRLPGLGPKFSFGRFVGEAVEWGVEAVEAFTTEVVGTARFEEGFVLDQSRLDDEMLEPSVVRIEAIVFTDSPVKAEAMQPWPNIPWLGTSWGATPQLAYGGPDGTLG